MTVRPVQVLGAGGHAKVVIATLEEAGYQVIGVYDDDPALRGKDCLGVPIRGAIETAEPLPSVLAIGDNRVRARVAARLSCPWVTAVHPRAWVHGSVVLGPGTVVFAGAVIQPDAVLGAHVIVNTAASVDHDCLLGDFVHLGPGVHLCGAVTVDEGALVGVGASARPGVHIGAWSTIGAGAAVVGTINAGTTATGVPARSRE